MHGQEARFTGAMWHLMPAMKNKVRGKQNCPELFCETIYSRPKCCLLSPVFMLLLLAIYIYWYIENFFGSVASTFSGPLPPSGSWPSESEEPYPTTFVWEVSGTDAQSSALFERGGVSNLQLVYDPQ